MGETNEAMQGKVGEQPITSVSKEGITSEEPQTYTTEQATKMVSDALAKAGREDKALKAREETVASREAVEAQRQKERDAEELEAAQGNPVALDALQNKRDRAQLDRDKAEHQAEIVTARETKREISIWEIATKYGVGAESLKALNLNVEQTEAVAKAMSDGKEPLTEEGKKNPDSGVTTGGGEDFTTIRFDKNAPTARQMISKGVNKK